MILILSLYVHARQTFMDELAASGKLEEIEKLNAPPAPPPPPAEERSSKSDRYPHAFNVVTCPCKRRAAYVCVLLLRHSFAFLGFVTRPESSRFERF